MTLPSSLLPSSARRSPRAVAPAPRLLGAMLAALLLAAPALAADSKPAKPARSKAPAFVPGKPIEPLLTRDELRDCLARQRSNREHTDDVSKMKADIDREKTELAQGSEALKAELATLDRGNAEAVAGYNSRVAERGQRVGAFEQLIADFNARVVALEADRTSFKNDCESRKFDEKDEKALRNE